MKWRYHRYEVDASRICPTGEVFRPEAKLCIRGRTGEAFLRPLIDTGADHSIFPMSVANLIGAELFEDEPDAAQGVGGQAISIIPGKVSLELLSEEDSCAWIATVGFAEFADPAEECSLLGHAGCLEYFSAMFDGLEQIVQLTPRGVPPLQA